MDFELPEELRLLTGFLTVVPVAQLHVDALLRAGRVRRRRPGDRRRRLTATDRHRPPPTATAAHRNRPFQR